jgi:membrane fusion protein, multidrug efflux system
MQVVVKAGLSSVVIVTGLAVGMQFLGSSAPEALPPPAPAVPVVEASVQQRDMPIILTGLGTVQALNTAAIRSQVTGLLQTYSRICSAASGPAPSSMSS